MLFRRKKSTLLLPAIVAAIIIMGISLSLIFLKSITSSIMKEGESQEFVVGKGQSAKIIAQNLENAGLIRSRYGFRYALKRLNLDNKLQAGVYVISPAMDAYQVARTLTIGIADIKITIPEGFRIEQIGEVVEEKLGISYQDFIVAAVGEEGYLFPDTYFVRAGAVAKDVVKLLKDNFQRKFPNVDKKTVILASLVERETKGQVEKPVVAGILLKRLDNNWPLELDATIQYGVGKKGNWWPNTTLADREKKSPYNTYLNQGLPPAPIGNPGADSLNAVLKPTLSEYWFYLHEPNGTIHYAKTNAEHSANIKKYLYK